MSKIFFLNKNIILIYFKIKKTLKNNHKCGCDIDLFINLEIYIESFFFILYTESIWECGGDYFSKYFLFINALK